MHRPRCFGGLCGDWGLFPHLFFLRGASASRQEPVAATEELWPGSLSGLFPRPHCRLCPSSYHPSGWGSHFLTSFQMMTRATNIVQAWVRHLRDIRVSATWKFPWRIRELWDGPDHKGIHPQQDNLRAPCQAHITLSKAEPIVPWPLPPQQNCKVESSACLPYHVHFFFFPSGLI